MTFEPSHDEVRRGFGDDPWRLTVEGLDPEWAAVDETVFALGNGYLGMRGNHEEGLPLGSHGTFINGLHETWRIQHPENAYGFAEHGQTVVNAPDAKTIRLYVDDERLNLETAELLDAKRTLDMREGTLHRTLLWRTPTGKRVQVDTRRMVSFTARHLVTIEMAVTVLDDDAVLTLSSLLINRQDLGRVTTEFPTSTAAPGLFDPRKTEQISERVLDPGPSLHEGGRSVMSYRVHNSGMTVAVGADHHFCVGDGDLEMHPASAVADPSIGVPVETTEGNGNWHTRVETSEDRVRHLYQGRAAAGQTVRLVKTVAYHSSKTAGTSELVDRCVQSLEQFAADGFERRWDDQRRFLADFWDRSDVEVEIDGDTSVQQAIRWNLFQLAQASARADGRGVPAKGLTGSGYSGHYFWDSEIYVLNFLTYTSPRWARNALRMREGMLPKARTRAMMLNEEGALFPWRTINGEEASAYYAAGTAAYHINADVTYALARYVAATGDLEYLVSGACDIPVETARLWTSLGFWRSERDGRRVFHIHGVTGPDEYTTVVNDNLFTNVMARFNLRFAAEVVRRFETEAPEAYAELVERLHLDPAEVEAWERAADGMSIPYSEEQEIHPQDAHFLEREVWDLEATPPEQKPLLLHFHPLVIYRFQVLKQADVVLALLLASDEFTREEKRADFEYYDALTTGDSTLSAVVQSIIATEVGYRDLGYRYFDHALRVDLDNLHHNSADGAHVASTGGVWMVLAQGFAGMRDAGRKLSFDPRLPDGWSGMRLRLEWRGSRLLVALRPDSMRFEIVAGDQEVPVTVRGEEFRVRPGEPVTVPLDGQGPDLGPFRGLSAGMLPRDGESATGAFTGSIPIVGAGEVPVVTTSIPTVQPDAVR